MRPRRCPSPARASGASTSEATPAAEPCSSTGAARPPVRATAPSTSTTSRANAIVASPRSTGSGCRVGDVRISRGTVAFARDCGGRALDGLYLKRPGKPVRRMRGVPAEPIRRFSGRSVVRPRRQHRGVHPQPAARRPGGGHLVADDRGARAPAGAAAQPAPRARAPARVPRPLRSLRRGRAPRLRGSRTGSGRCSPRTTGRRSSGARSTGARPRRSSSGPAGSTSDRQKGDRLGSYAVSGDRLYYSRPAYAGSEAFIAQVAGTPVFR